MDDLEGVDEVQKARMAALQALMGRAQAHHEAGEFTPEKAKELWLDHRVELAKVLSDA
jgi:hypothetical protein